MTVPAPRIAAQDAPGAQPATFEKAMGFHSLEKILRACRSEPAARTRTADGMNDRRNDALIATDENADEPFHGEGGNGGADFFESRP